MHVHVGTLSYGKFGRKVASKGMVLGMLNLGTASWMIRICYLIGDIGRRGTYRPHTHIHTHVHKHTHTRYAPLSTHNRASGLIAHPYYPA